VRGLVEQSDDGAAGREREPERVGRQRERR
jgi:hypothetical protein